MYSMTNLSKLTEQADLDGRALPRVNGRFPVRDEAALARGAISKKYRELMAIAVALTTQRAYCLDLHRRVDQ
jgi:alkylhydroperoxidase/carboxymuconolactone decarboxylase family protein YurZ